VFFQTRSGLAKQSKLAHQWISIVDNFSQSLKVSAPPLGQLTSCSTNERLSVQEVGDIENWTERIESDMRAITTALEYVHKGNCSFRLHALFGGQKHLPLTRCNSHRDVTEKWIPAQSSGNDEVSHI
jgi:hypothetical protein